MLYMKTMKVYYVFFWFVHRYAYTHCILLYIQYMYVHTKIVMDEFLGVPSLDAQFERVLKLRMLS